MLKRRCSSTRRFVKFCRLGKSESFLLFVIGRLIIFIQSFFEFRKRLFRPELPHISYIQEKIIAFRVNAVICWIDEPEKKVFVFIPDGTYQFAMMTNSEIPEEPESTEEPESEESDEEQPIEKVKKRKT